METSSPPPPNGGPRKLLFAPGAEFTPKAFESKKEVLRATFVTQTVPNIPNYAGIVGICTVPEEKAGMDDLGWHIADFLAFRALLCGDNNPKAQSWLSMCDIPTLVQENPEQYVHGKDRRLVSSGASQAQYQTHAGLVDRDDSIEIETSAQAFKDKFVAAIKKKLAILRKYKYPFLLIICGPTSLEQDIYLGQIDINHRYTMEDLRQDLGDDINYIDATIVTPALFSAGWKVNTSFGRFNATEVRGNRYDFLARQFGGVFARQLVPIFLGWQCPAIDDAKLDPQVKSLESFPGPVQPSDGLKALTVQLESMVHSCLVGELSAFHQNHSFSFDKKKDEWETVINSRESQQDYRPLNWYKQKWCKLPFGPSLEPADNGFEFLGNAFGGTRTSQLNHLKYLIEESYLAWPDLCNYTWGQATKKQFEQFKLLQNPNKLECQEIFYVLEHRARMSILGDTIIEYFDLPMPTNERCRDFNNHSWKQHLPETVRSSLIKHFGTVIGSVTGPNVPPGVNLNSMNKLQRRLESCASYIQASLAIRFLTSKDSSSGAVDLIEKFLQDVKQKQLELLAGNTEIYRLCCNWLSSISIPTRDLRSTVMATQSPESWFALEETGPLDCDDDYEVYQDGDRSLDNVESYAVGGYPINGFHGQQPSSRPQTPAVPVQEQVYVTPARTVNDATGMDEDVIMTSPMQEVTQTPQCARQGFPQELVDLEHEQTKLRTEIQATKSRSQRQKLVERLAALLEREKELLLADTELLLGVKTPQSVHANKSAATDLLISPVRESSPVGEMMERAEVQVLETRVDPLVQEVQENFATASLGTTSREKVNMTGRKTPPHLRGMRKRD